MRVIVAFECSGVVRDAFLRAGHDAYSCDLRPNYTGPPERHFRIDAREIDFTGYDLAIMHPPCTRLAVSGARHFRTRKQEQKAALELVDWCFRLKIKRKAVENPISIISSHFRKPNQIIHPWWFGDNEAKATCLWLWDLPLLVPTHPKPLHIRTSVHYATPSPTRSADRSRTMPGIGDAMALQWGDPMILF